MGTITVDPKITEDFLLMQEDVLDASVWIDGGALRAHVTRAPGSAIDEIALKGVCVAHIGSTQTPSEILLIAGRND
ncbi:MAG TPA: hypothetical protein VG944_05185 [Fimbriimonas sp.]|nr:hypothetical protein [Fimbriimonas sp.]